MPHIWYVDILHVTCQKMPIVLNKFQYLLLSIHFIDYKNKTLALTKDMYMYLQKTKRWNFFTLTTKNRCLRATAPLRWVQTVHLRNAKVNWSCQQVWEEYDINVNKHLRSFDSVTLVTKKGCQQSTSCIEQTSSQITVTLANVDQFTYFFTTTLRNELWCNM